MCSNIGLGLCKLLSPECQDSEVLARCAVTALNVVCFQTYGRSHDQGLTAQRLQRVLVDTKDACGLMRPSDCVKRSKQVKVAS